MLKNEIDYDQFKSEEFKSSKNKTSRFKSKSKTQIVKKSRLSFLSPKNFYNKIVSIVGTRQLFNKITITLFIIFIYRLLAAIPLPGVDMAAYQEQFSGGNITEGSFLLTAFTGGQLESPSIVGLGIAAYINASIIIQLLTPVIPKLEQLSKEGEQGRMVINQITRYLTLPLAFLYSFVFLLFISRVDLNDTTGSGIITDNPQFLIPANSGEEYPTMLKIIFMALILTAGSMFLMWLAEAITENGIGNGASIIITIGILSALPSLIYRDFQGIDLRSTFESLISGNFSEASNPLLVSIIAIFVGAIVLVGLIVFINESARKIKIQYSRRAVATIGAENSHLPIKLTLTGVLPIIFASAFMSMPQLVVPFLKNSVVDPESGFYEFLVSLENSFLFASSSLPEQQIVDSRDTMYAIVYFLLILGFGIFYAFIVMKPADTAENLQKQGAFIPGVRPGKATENFITAVLMRISFWGAIFLGFLALLPLITRNFLQITISINPIVLSGIGGTSILIAVSVILDTVRQYRAMKVTRSYEKYATL